NPSPPASPSTTNGHGDSPVNSQYISATTAPSTLVAISAASVSSSSGSTRGTPLLYYLALAPRSCLLIAQRDDWIGLRGCARWIDAKENADGGRDAKRQQDRVPRHYRRPAGDKREHDCHQRADQDADDTAQH